MGDTILVILIPNDNESEIDFNNSNAEKKLYHAFKALDDNYYVFHSINIPVKNGVRIIDKEIDFIIFNPYYGILCIEVKGGHIKYENNTLKQKKNKDMYNPQKEDNYNDIHPFKQLKSVKYSLVKTLKKRIPKGFRGYELYSCVWLADIKKREINELLPLNYNYNRILGKEHLNNIQDSIERVFKDLTNNTRINKNERAIKTVIDTIAPDFQAFIPLNELFNNHKSKFKSMTKNQIEVIKAFENNKAVIVDGMAGTGKSIIALEQAKKLSEDNNDTIIICFNKFLKLHFKNHLSNFNRNIRVMNMYDLYYSFRGETLENFNKDEQEKFLKSLFLEIESIPFKNIIIDEAQDFTADILRYLYEITKIKDGKYYAFYDLNQKHTNNNSEEWLQNDFLPKATLFNNCRNTIEIAETISKFNTKEIVYCKHYISGAKPSMNIISNRSKLIEQLINRINYYMRQGVKYTNIVILSLGNQSKLDATIFGELSVSLEQEEDKILFTTARKFKGLEADIVFIVDLPKNVLNEEKYRNLLYIAVSRAKHIAEIFVDYNNDEYKYFKNSLLQSHDKILKTELARKYGIELTYNYQIDK